MYKLFVTFAPCKQTDMARYFIYLAFDGIPFHGWQRQPNGHTVQAEVERCLSLLAGRAVEVTGAGRTDAGVHASMMVAHFDFDGQKMTAEELTRRLRKMLPPEVFVYAVVPVKSDAHARFDALERTYHYYICTEANPFSRGYAYRLPYKVSFARMNRAAAVLLQHTDFTSFSKVHTDVRTFNCRVTRAEWTQVGPTLWRFDITADRFLRNMVRAVVGTLIGIGRGDGDEAEAMRRVLLSKSRSAAGESVPGHALFLSDIRYPASVFADGKEPLILSKKEAYVKS